MGCDAHGIGKQFVEMRMGGLEPRDGLDPVLLPQREQLNGQARSSSCCSRRPLGGNGAEGPQAAVR
jgi:hypothetical protein